jgi:DNA polymerase III epsilon subunit-like protein
MSILPKLKNKFFVDIAKGVIARKPIYLDTETTGLGNNDEIIELAIIDYNGDVLFNNLIKPSKLIVRNAVNIHGISNDMVNGSKRYSEYLVEINKILKDRLICCYNIEFDMRMITQSNKIYRYINKDTRDTFCVMKFFAQMNGNFNRKFGDYTNVSLENVAKELKILTGRQTHRALDDAVITRRCLIKICEHDISVKQESMF